MLTVGLPGSGKTTYLDRLGVNAIASDEVRRLLADDPTDQSIHGRVFSTIRFLIAQRLAIGRPVTYVDATHLTRKDRHPYFGLGAAVEAIYFDVPLEICLERNRRRTRQVPEEAILSMARMLEPPAFDEGFAKIDAIPA